MSRPHRLRAFAALSAGALVAGTVALSSAPAAAAPVSLTIVSFNDFHGRIDANTTKFATTIEQLRVDNGESQTAVISAGDNIGASLFASAYFEDEPTVEVLNALDLPVSAAGNHEFDRGFEWLKTHVIDGTVAGYTKAAFTLLGANVRNAADDSPAMEEGYRMTVSGQSLCVVGGVTGETPALVSPDGIAGLHFKAPVAEINAAAEAMEAEETCDVTVATYHEGAPSGSKTLEENLAASPSFADIVNNTSPLVDVIITGHTHQQYAWMADKPGGGTRPVVEAGSYGSHVGVVQLSVDGDTVTPVSVATQQRSATENLALPRVAAVKTIVDAALNEASVVGDQPVGNITADITTAYSGGSYGDHGYEGGTRDDRANESTLANLVADALHSTPIAGQDAPDLALVNPGGQRAELFYTANASPDNNSPLDDDGVVTYEEANAVLPFVNNISYVTIAGKDLKTLFEQQWQRDSTGAVPSRPFLQLGVSANVHATLDPTLPEGQHLTALTVDGKQVKDGDSFVVATPSFLAAGGDNFRAFTEGTAVDTGKVDRDLWIDAFLGQDPAKSPDFQRRQMYVAGPTTIEAGASTELHMTKIDLTSLGSPQTNDVEATLIKPDGKRVSLGTFPVTAGAVDVPISVDSRTPRGSIVHVESTATNAYTELKVVATTPTMKVQVRPGTIVKKETRPRIVVKLKANDKLTVKGEVKIKVAGKSYTRKLKDGVAEVKLPTFNKTGKKSYTVTFLATDSMSKVVETGSFKVTRG